MHPAVLDATGYTLLLSSLITLAILLRKGYRRKRKSPFYILSTSDVLSTILTAILLLVNHIEAGIRLNYNANGTSNHTWTLEDGSSYQLPFLQIYNLRTATDETNSNVNLTCDMKDIFMQYGMLLAALTNAFISLLTFNVQCNFNAACVKQRCADVIKSSVNNVERKSAEAARRERGMLKDEEQASEQGDNISVKKRSDIIQRITKISKFRMLDDDKKPASFLVMSHWLVPFLVVGILYFAGYNDMNSSRRTEDTECVFESNFPMSNFHMFSDVGENLEIVNSIIHTTPSKNNYFLNEEYLNKSKPSSVEVDEIVSKVQSIVRTVLNYTDNSTGNTNSLGSSGTEKYILTNNIMSYMKNNTDIDNVIKILNDTLIKQNVSVHNSSSNKDDIYFSQDLEVSLFHNTSEKLDVITSGYSSDVSQVSVENKNDSYQEDAQIHFATTEENATRRTTSVPIVQNGTTVSNPIYDDIIKRIQVAVKGHNRSINRHEERLERNNLNDYNARKPNAIRNLSSSKNDDLNHYINVETRSGSLYVINECLVSTEFLKLHLFVLFIAIYFLPILFCCVLHVRGRYICKNALAILRAQADLVASPPRNGVDSNEDNSTCIVHEFHSEFRLFPDDKRAGHQNSIEESDESQDLRNETATQVVKKDHQSCRENTKTGETQNESILLEMDCMVRIFDTIKLSLILCIVLWTPAFLGTLLKVFSCIHAPQWLIDTTFLSAISFGVVRNILNINIIKIQDICGDASTKENRIHPIE